MIIFFFITFNYYWPNELVYEQYHTHCGAVFLKYDQGVMIFYDLIPPVMIWYHSTPSRVILIN